MRSVPRWLTEFAFIVAAVLLIRATLVQAFNIPSASMQPTLLIGDFILVNKLVYRLSDPRRGDIIVFKYPENPSLDYIKRLIAGPGDLVEFEEFYDEKAQIRIYRVKVNGRTYDLRYIGLATDRGGFYYEFEERIPVNGKEVRYRVWFSALPIKVAGLESYNEDWCLERRDNLCVKFRVPDGHFFVMGDNRDKSEDSRFWGFVPRENVVGKAFVIYLSGEVPPLTPDDVTFLTGFRQLLLALIHPRPGRIGTSFIY